MTEERQSMQLLVEKLQFVSEAWEALRAAEEQRHSEARSTRGGSCVCGSEEPERFKDTHQCTENIEILSVNHQNDGEGGQIQCGSGSVHPARDPGQTSCSGASRQPSSEPVGGD